ARARQAPRLVKSCRPAIVGGILSSRWRIFKAISITHDVAAVNADYAPRMASMNASFLTTLVAALTLSASLAWAGEFRVTLLGTGTPTPRADRFSQSTLVEAGPQKLVFDLGRGVTIRLSSINAHFLTHFHSDHTVGLPDLWLTGWLPPSFGRRASPFVLYGPVGARALADGLEKAFADDIRIRLLDEKNPPQGIAFDVHEFAA